MRRLVFAVALLAAGCAENAILELDIVAPEDATGALFVHVLSTTRIEEFDELVVEGLGTEPVEIPLDGEAPPHVSVIADGPEITQPLYVGLNICDDTPCAPVRVLRIERAFYLGRTTHLDLDLRGRPLAGTEIEEVSRCAVRGCGRSEAGDHCFAGPDGPTHFCGE